MTAEIAILNRSAAALAADSAVTIRIGNTEKIYNTAEKIFEFSRQCPIGAMIFNSVEFMGLPWDVLIRRFRAEKDFKHVTVRAGADAFLAYLKQVPVLSSHEDDHLRSLLNDIFFQLSEDFYNTLRMKLISKPKSLPDGKVVFQARARIMRTDFAKSPVSGFLESTTQGDFDARYGPVCEEVARKIFKSLPLEVDDYALLKELAFHAVKSEASASGSTGLVFAGYADANFFPSMVSLVVDGIYMGALKHWFTDDRGVDREDSPAIIAPFAQREMVDRFVYGIDDEFENYVADHFQEAAERIVNKVIEFINSGRKRPLKFDCNFSSDIASEAATEFQDVLLRNIKGLYLRDIYDIVTAMPKAELASMAESLVSLTSVKRKVSVETETVGGPVDVALITKSEGFIWIKRKHYFSKDQNPGFFARQYEQGKGEAHATQ